MSLARPETLWGEGGAFVFLSSHYHLLVRVADAKQLADFTGISTPTWRVDRASAGWTTSVVAPLSAIVISEEEAAQRRWSTSSVRVKEDLVPALGNVPAARRPCSPGRRGCRGSLVRPYPGPPPPAGEAFERAASRLGDVVLHRCRGWEHLSPEKQRERVAEVSARSRETAARRKRTGAIPLGRGGPEAGPARSSKKIKSRQRPSSMPPASESATTCVRPTSRSRRLTGGRRSSSGRSPPVVFPREAFRQPCPSWRLTWRIKSFDPSKSTTDRLPSGERRGLRSRALLKDSCSFVLPPPPRAGQVDEKGSEGSDRGCRTHSC